MQPGPVRGWRLLLGLARAKHRGLFCLHLDAWRARQREPMIPVCWWSHGTDSMAGAGWQGRRSMQAGPGDCQLTGPTCRPSASVGTVCLNPTQERSEAGPARCWRLLPCLARTKSRGLIAWSSAIGNASRRNIRLAGRSLAACWFCRLPAAPSAISENRNTMTVRAARGAQRRGSWRTATLRTAFICRRVFWRSGERSARIGAGLGCLTGRTALPWPVSAV